MSSFVFDVSFGKCSESQNVLDSNTPKQASVGQDRSTLQDRLCQPGLVKASVVLLRMTPTRGDPSGFSILEDMFVVQLLFLGTETQVGRFISFFCCNLWRKMALKV